MRIDYRDGIGKVGSKPEDAHRSCKIFGASIYLISRTRKVFKHSTIYYIKKTEYSVALSYYMFNIAIHYLS